MDIETCEIPEVRLIRLKQHCDSRGCFSEAYNKRAFAAAGIEDEFVQDNQSFSEQAGTIRGFHFQKLPHAQAKLVRVIAGRIMDCALDLRRNSPSYGHCVVRELSVENRSQMYIPVGFAHAFCTLEPKTQVIYKVTSFYAPGAEAGIIWSDPDLHIDWPVPRSRVICSEKDAQLPKMRDLESEFSWHP